MTNSSKLKIYFACSIRGGRDGASIYPALLQAIQKRAQVLSEIFADQRLTADGMNKPSREIWITDIAWVKQADAIIAEVTTPSLGVGYEIAKAEEWGKPVLALFDATSGRKLSAMIDGSPQVCTKSYGSVADAETAIAEFIASLQ